MKNYTQVLNTYRLEVSMIRVLSALRFKIFGLSCIQLGCFLHLFLSICVINIQAQSNLSIGQWATHLPYNKAFSVASSDEFSYFATEYSILKVDKTDLSFERLTKSEGLHGNIISTIYYHFPTQTLVIAYSNGLIDLYSKNGFKAVSDLQNFNNIPINKQINSLSYEDDEHVFINAEYGISSLNVASGRFEYNVFTEGRSIYKTVKFGDKTYAASSNGLWQYKNSNQTTIQDFSSWINRSEDNSGLYSNTKVNDVELFDNKLYVASSSSLFVLNSASRFDLLTDFNGFNVQYIKSGPYHLITGISCDGNCANQVKLLDKNSNWTQIAVDCVEKNIDAVEDSKGVVWLADERWGFRFTRSDLTCEILFVNAPSTNSVFEILPATDALYVAPGGYDNTITYQYKADGILKYQNNNWTALNNTTVPVFDSVDMRDIVRAVEHPDKTKIYFASNQRGLIEYNKLTQKFTIYNDKNSSLQAPNADPTRIRLTGLAFDKNKNLWITSFLSPKPLTVFRADGSWQSFELPGFSSQVHALAVDNQSNKWILPREASGVIVFNENDPTNTKDDEIILLNDSNTEIQNNRINTLQMDLDGDMWVGTPEGPVVFECTSSLFKGTCKGTRKKYVQDGIPYYLLQSEDITSIAIDGGNRKWFGTRNGIYVVSASTDQQIHIFNTENSPLLNNSIIDIAVDPLNGNAWIGTEGGLQVFRTDATVGFDNSFMSEVTAFPNPAMPGYNGPIAIRGLSRDARVKITDVNGRLVYETNANGGEAIWNGRDYLGNSAASGVYLVWANTTKNLDKSTGIVTKLVIVR